MADTTANPATQPPEKLADLIEETINRSRQLDHSVYRPNWAECHSGKSQDGACQIDFAGAAVATFLALDPAMDFNAIWSTNPDSDTSDLATQAAPWLPAIQALTQIQMGNLGQALRVYHEGGDDSSLVQRVSDPSLPEAVANASEFEDWTAFETFLDLMHGALAEVRQAEQAYLAKSER